MQTATSVNLDIDINGELNLYFNCQMLNQLSVFHNTSEHHWKFLQIISETLEWLFLTYTKNVPATAPINKSPPDTTPITVKLAANLSTVIQYTKTPHGRFRGEDGFGS